jgi:F0F1-type ATP synthase membrane subunit b/b'
MTSDDFRIWLALALFYVLAIVAMFVTDRIEKRLRSRRLLSHRRRI